MKNLTLALLCSATFLYACDGSKETGSTMGAAENTPNQVVSEANELTETSTAVAAKASDDNQAESIYKSKCVACHGGGVAGAPKLGDKAAWAARIAQGDEVLLQHAIKGFKGDTGYMPPKGGFMALSDEEISAAVQYMVSQSQ
mgnify:CR=1 FL=1